MRCDVASAERAKARNPQGILRLRQIIERQEVVKCRPNYISAGPRGEFSTKTYPNVIVRVARIKLQRSPELPNWHRSCGSHR